jgi:hypothetical protein
VFVDVISVSAVLYLINFASCYQNGPKRARKEAKEGRDGNESNHNLFGKYVRKLLVFLVNYAHYTTLIYYEKVR